MKFFIPHAKDEKEAESVFEGIAKFIQAPVTKERIRKLKWKHEGKDFECEVGEAMPSYYQTGEEPVLAIFDCSNHYKICTPNRGGLRGEPIMAGKSYDSQAEFFE